MKKLLGIIVLGLLLSGNAYAEKFPEELKHKELGFGMKKLSKNFLCKNITDNKDKIKFSYQEFNTSNEKILFALGYDEDNKIFYLPISILTKYENLEDGDKNKNELFVGYRLMGNYDNQNLFTRFIFFNPKSTGKPYYYLEETYILSDDEQNTFNLLTGKSWGDEFTEELWVNSSHQEKFLKDLIIENNKFHELISKDFKSFKNPTIKNLTEPDDARRLNRLNSLSRMAGIPTPFYQCGKK